MEYTCHNVQLKYVFSDFMDMMMIQHQQVNQLVMQQMMMKQFGGQNRQSYPCYPSYYYAEPAQPVLVRFRRFYFFS